MATPNVELNDLVKSLLLEYGVPLPGGHGARFPNLRKLPPDPQRPNCNAYFAAPGPHATALVCLAMLGMRDPANPDRSYFSDKGGERWFGTNFLVHVTDWWQQRTSDLVRRGRQLDVVALSTIKRRHRWRYALHAMAQLARAPRKDATQQLQEMLQSGPLPVAIDRLAQICVQLLSQRSRRALSLGPVPDILAHQPLIDAVSQLTQCCRAVLTKRELQEVDGRLWLLKMLQPLTAELHALSEPEQQELVADLVKAWLLGFEERQRAFVDQCLVDAEKRLTGLVDQWHGAIPPALAPVRGITLRSRDPRWDKANDLLASAGRDRELASAMYFAHLFHANVSLLQPALTTGAARDKKKRPTLAPDAKERDGRLSFYQALLRLLEHSCVQVRGTADLVVAGLRDLPLFNQDHDKAATKRVQELCQELPECFGNSLGYAAPHVEDSLSQLTDAVAKQSVRALHQLAEMVDDQLLNPSRVRITRRGAPGFCYEDYIYVDGVARYGQRLEKRSALDLAMVKQAPSDVAKEKVTKLLVDSYLYRKDMAAYFANMMGERIDEMVDLNLPAACSTEWPGDDVLPRACAMCLIQIRPH